MRPGVGRAILGVKPQRAWNAVSDIVKDRMESFRFDRLTRLVSLHLSRRTLAGAVGLATLALPHRIEAKKNRKKKKKIKRNAFGCVNVGTFCKNSSQCCSGICQGKKGKKKCQAHDTGSCQPGHTQLDCGGEDVPCLTNTGLDGLCDTTTGNAAFCSVHKVGPQPPCTRDADCKIFDPRGACIRCGAIGTLCAVSD